MKRAITALLALCILMLTACGGDISGVQRIIGESEVHTEGAVQTAMQAVESHFKKHFSGCTLKELAYDEAVYGAEGEEWAKQYEADAAIVLVSTFDVDGSGGDGSLKPNSTYTGWKWILTRSDGGAWVLRTWGYG